MAILPGSASSTQLNSSDSSTAAAVDHGMPVFTPAEQRFMECIATPPRPRSESSIITVAAANGGIKDATIETIKSAKLKKVGENIWQYNLLHAV